jgi:hypothetical protein
MQYHVIQNIFECRYGGKESTKEKRSTKTFPFTTKYLIGHKIPLHYEGLDKFSNT